MQKRLVLYTLAPLLLFMHTVRCGLESKLLKTSFCSLNDVDQLAQKWGANFCYPDMLVSLTYNEGAVVLNLIIENQEKISAEECTLFSENSTDNKKSWQFTYVMPTLVPTKKSAVSESHDCAGEYIIAPRRHFSVLEPAHIITVEQLADLLRNKKILFYTGAGISDAAGVDMMAPLLKVLMLDTYDDIVHNVVTYPEQIAQAFYTFCQTAFNNSPTPAHNSIAILTQEHSAALITENFDFLHERSGITPYKIQSYMLRQEDPAVLQQIDALVCVGLSHDDRGFIGWYKQHNPNGLLIAFDLKQPRYLNQDDYLVCGDLQELLPQLEQNLKHKSLITVI